MAIHYSNGLGQLYDKETKQPITQVSYRLIETDPTKYTKKKWWGELSSAKEIKETKDSVIFRIEFEDSRDGECAVWVNTEADSETAQRFNYHFNGRGRLGRDFKSGIG